MKSAFVVIQILIIKIQICRNPTSLNQSSSWHPRIFFTIIIRAFEFYFAYPLTFYKTQFYFAHQNRLKN